MTKFKPVTLKNFREIKTNLDSALDDISNELCAIQQSMEYCIAILQEDIDNEHKMSEDQKKRMLARLVCASQAIDRLS